MSTYFKVVSTVEQLFNNDSLVTTLYIDNDKLKKINTRFSITNENTYDYRHEYLDTTQVSTLVSSITKIKFTTVERHFRTWRRGKRALNKQLLDMMLKSVD